MSAKSNKHRPLWLLILQIAGVVLLFLAIALQFCRMAFGYWEHETWVGVTVVSAGAVFAISMLLLIRWQRIKPE